MPDMRIRIAQTFAVTALLLFTAGTLMTAVAKEPFTLDAIQRDIESRYKGVKHLTPERLETLMQARQGVLLLDVREIREYNVSHIPSARQVSPNIWHGPFMQRFAGKARGKTVVFYCSVGVRSSKLARYVGDALLKAGAGPVYNLQGGIFSWHNAGRKLTNAKGQTPFVHPYDRYWGQLVTRKNLTRITPQ